MLFLKSVAALPVIFNGAEISAQDGFDSYEIFEVRRKRFY